MREAAKWRRVNVLLWVVSSFLVGALVLSFLCPPWTYTFRYPTGAMREEILRPAGYAWVFDPPNPRQDNFPFGVILDWPRLISQVSALLLLLGFVLMIRWKLRKPTGHEE